MKKSIKTIGVLFSLELIFLFVLFPACKHTKAVSGDKENKSPLIIMEKSGLKLTEVVSPPFNESGLVQISPSSLSWSDTGMVGFKYSLKNYELGVLTSDWDAKLCGNSEKGQHIHHILNNEPYTALYQPIFEKSLKEGQYINLSFLSRSYHESIKNKNAYTLTQFNVGNQKVTPADLSQPFMFYSRPKGEYKGYETKYVLLDFYLVNTDLSKKGNKVIAEINGVEFIIDSWVPFIIEGLPAGESTIKLSLVDKNGELVKTLYNPVERKIVLSNMIVR
jgi:hypothetical protein